MKITDICIERFGVWKDLHLPLTKSGVTVLYGPNEAGKTTLLRFIRGVLFGFRPHSQEGFPRPHRIQDDEQAGSLAIDFDGQHCELRRQSRRGSRGELTVNGLDNHPESNERLMQLLAGIDETLFEHVFAIGLHELQELATLEGDAVARQIYDLSLGLEGETLLGATAALEQKRTRLLDSHSQSGRLAELFARHDSLSEQIASLETVVEEHAVHCSERDRLSEHISQCRLRQNGMQSQLKGHQFLERVWPCWKQVQELESELHEIPVVREFTPDGIERLNNIEQELEAQQSLYDAARTKARKFKRRAKRLSVSSVMRRSAEKMRSFVDQREWLEELQLRVDQGRSQSAGLRKEFEQSLSVLGQDWSLERLEAADTSPTARSLLLDAAEQYRNSMARRARLRKKYQRASDYCHQTSAEHNELMKSSGTDSVADAIAVAKCRLAEIQDVCQSKREERELNQRLTGIGQQLEVLQRQAKLPKWVQIVLAVIGGAGAIFSMIGLIVGISINVIAGTAYALLGATAVGLFFALKNHFQNHTQDQVRDLRLQKLGSESKLQEVQALIREVAEQDDGLSTDLSETQLIEDTARRLVELERLGATHENILNMRRKLSECRQRISTLQKDVSVGRRNWCESLKQFGFSESIRIDEALEEWQLAAEANERRRAWRAAESNGRYLGQTLDSIRTRIETLSREEGRLDLDYRNPAQVLSAWEKELKDLDGRREERRRFIWEAAASQRECARYQSRLDELMAQRTVLLAEVGAVDREDFEQRVTWAKRRSDVEQMLDEARLELESAAEAEPELAIVEEDLASFKPADNAECIRALSTELEDLRDDLERVLQDYGRVDHQIQAMEADRKSAHLRFDREQVASEIAQAVEEWVATATSERIVDRIRTDFERSCQPATLARASRYLERLTCQKYRNVWTPLGRRNLYVDDEQGRAVPVDVLSGGAREQLFLAVRLAMIEGFSSDGSCIPIVLDDIFVNFDQRRSEAAADVMIDFASQGRQLLFLTCHLHLAHLFESKGIDPVWLPAHQREFGERRAG